PKLEEEGYLTVYARTLRDPPSEVKQAVRDRLNRSVSISQETTETRFLGENGFLSTDLYDFLDIIIKQEKKPLVLILDQFEEFFIRLGPSVQEPFIQQLARVYDAPNLPVKLVISLREDFLAELGEMEVHIPSVFNNRFRLQPLTDEQAKEAIEEPAKLYGVSYEKGLLDRLLTDLSQQGVEPLQLQIVCNKLWNKLGSGETVITYGMYEQTGGARQILAGYVGEVLVEFDKQTREIARAILKEMVTSRQTRVLQDLPMIQEKLATRFPPEMVTQALQRLMNRRLVRSLEKDDTLYYELAHEYLIEKIRDWFDEEEVALKKAQEMLERAQENYVYSSTLMPRSQVKIVEQYQDRLIWSSIAKELLQKSKKRNRRILFGLIGLVAALLFLISFTSYKQYLAYQEDFRKRYDMGYFPEVSNPDQAELRFYRIGKDHIEEAEKFHGAYLIAGDYYLQAKKEGWTLKYPVHIKGYGTEAKPVQVEIPKGLQIPEDMVYIPAGWFRMGDKENRGNADEKPAHDVYVDAFFMDQREVVYQAYRKFMEDGGYQNEKFWTEEGWRWKQALQVTQPVQWDNEKFNAPHKPVVGASWYEADAYCKWANKQLPTEAEWEKAARGPEGYVYVYGNVYDESKIDTKDPNGYGLYKMTGGVWEWVFDGYDQDYYSVSQDAKNPRGPAEGKYRILRGGDSLSRGERTRTSFRDRLPPESTPPTKGFRCVRRDVRN
ncbi:MAG: formylglycine-generating enzyme family protein, partial [Nitrospira sp.]|nr:formylglycine-generating enzyme family protein [Nitrospira sp.]